MLPIFLKLAKEEYDFGPRALYQTSVADTFPDHYHDFYEVFLVTYGKAVHSINNSQQLLSQGSLVFIRPNDVHSYAAINYFDFKIINIGYYISEIAPVLSYLGISPSVIDSPLLPIHLKIEGKQFDHLRDMLLELASLYPSQKCRPLFRSFASELYYPLLGAETEFVHTRTQLIPDWLYKLDIEMSKRHNYIQGLQRLMELCNYSQTHVIRSFQKYYKMSPTEYINSKRMVYACELILSNKYSITEICYQCGFNNLSHFYNVFHSIYHCTPKDFAARHM